MYAATMWNKKVLSGETEDQRELFNVVAVREQ